MLDINCRKCENLVDPENGCRQYGPNPARALPACAADHFKNYTVKPEFQRVFMPGEQAWVVERDEDGHACDVSGYMFLAEVAGAVILTPYINDIDDLEGTMQHHIEETAENYDTDLAVFPLADCYCAREEAIQALCEEREEE